MRTWPCLACGGELKLRSYHPIGQGGVYILVDCDRCQREDGAGAQSLAGAMDNLDKAIERERKRARKDEAALQRGAQGRLELGRGQPHRGR